MSIEIIRRVFEDSKSAGSDRLMLLALAEHADNSGKCWPSIGRLSKWCNTSTRNATRLINTLKGLGELEIGFCAGPRGTHMYQIKLLPLTAVSPPDSTVTPLTPDKDVMPPPDSQSTPPDSQRRSPLTAVSPEPSLNLQEPSKKNQQTTRASPRKSFLPDGFSISPEVQEWAAEKGYRELDQHLEYFIGYAKSSGKQYVDWDEAFMNAIRGNWAKVKNHQYIPNPIMQDDSLDRDYELRKAEQAARVAVPVPEGVRRLQQMLKGAI